MSAIAGVWRFEVQAENPAGNPISPHFEPENQCRRMLEALQLYGQDDQAVRRAGPLALGRCLLRLLPEDRYDHQPLSDEAFTAVADVRLDNRRDLIRELSIPGSEPMADSELLFRAWRRWRTNAVHHLEGAFAFAVWDAIQGQLYLARDHTGERPLYYFASGQHFAFATTAKGLLALPFVGSEISEEYVASYLTLVTTPPEQTIFRNILRVPAGSLLRVRPGNLEVQRYWQTDGLSPLRFRSEGEYLEMARTLMDHAVEVRMRTTGKIGAHLSGGLDSSSVAATAARLLSGTGGQVVAYTAVPQARFAAANEDSGHFDDEGPAAAEVAAMYPNLHHVLVKSSGASFLDVIDRNNDLYDHPCFSPTNEVWLNAIMDRARRDGVTVLLNGYCGNSTLSYNGFPALSEMLRRGQIGRLLRLAWRIRGTGSASVRSIALNAIWPSLPFWLRHMTEPEMRGFSLDYSPIHPQAAQQYNLKRRALRDLNTLPRGGRPMLDSLLRYGDVSETNLAPQGGWKLDFRDPTFDRHLVEFCLRVPLEEFLRGGRLRSLARRSMSDRLPASTLTRTARGRQSADWHLTMRPLRGRMLEEIDQLEKSPLASRMLDFARMRRLIEDWPTEGHDRGAVNRSFHLALTRGFSVGRFLRQYDPQAPALH